MDIRNRIGLTRAEVSARYPVGAVEAITSDPDNTELRARVGADPDAGDVVQFVIDEDDKDRGIHRGLVHPGSPGSPARNFSIATTGPGPLERVAATVMRRSAHAVLHFSVEWSRPIH